MASHTHQSTSSDADESTTSTRRLALVAAVNFIGFVVELAGGLLFGSVALISDALHMLFDMLAYVMAFGAAYTAERFAAGERWSYGLHRLEPIAAFLNGVLLVPMVGYIVWESYQRFLSPVEIDPAMTLLIAVGGLAVNIGAVYLLQGGEMSLNERGAFYHLLGDAGGSVAVIVSTIAVAVADVPIADPIAAVIIGGLVLWSAGKVLWESTSILLERSPVDPAQLREAIEGIDGVDTVLDMHIWQVCSQLTVGTIRVAKHPDAQTEYETIRTQIHTECRQADIDHTTVELVPHDAADAEPPTSTHTHS